MKFKNLPAVTHQVGYKDKKGGNPPFFDGKILQITLVLLSYVLLSTRLRKNTRNFLYFIRQDAKYFKLLWFCAIPYKNFNNAHTKGGGCYERKF